MRHIAGAVIALVLVLTLLAPSVALADSATDAALGLGAFAVFNQILGGVGVFGHAAPPAVVVAPPPPPVIAPAPPPVVYQYPSPAYYYPVPPVVYGHGYYAYPGWWRHHHHRHHDRW
jgi:hypothetical protein